MRNISEQASDIIEFPSGLTITNTRIAALGVREGARDEKSMSLRSFLEIRLRIF